MKRFVSRIFAMLFCLFLMTAVPAFGVGDGSGSGNHDAPLTLASASPADGVTGVPLDVIIELDFTKNICNPLVAADNSRCFHLTAVSDGTVIPLTVILPDDQVQRDIKRNAFLQPQAPLKQNTVYRISVDSRLTAKNGTSIDDAHQLEFTTGTAGGAKAPVLLTQLGESIQTFQTALPENEDSAPTGRSPLRLVFYGGMIAIGIALIALALRRRGHPARK